MPNCQVCDRKLWTGEFEDSAPIPGIDVCRACVRSALVYFAREAQGRPHLLPDNDLTTAAPSELKGD